MKQNKDGDRIVVYADEKFRKGEYLKLKIKLLKEGKSVSQWFREQAKKYLAK